MSIDIGAELPPFPESEGLGKIFERLDEERSDFFEATIKYTTMPTDSNLTKLYCSAYDVTGTIHEAIDDILNNEQSSETKGRMIATLITDEDTKRIEYFNSLADDQKLCDRIPLDKEEISDDVKCTVELLDGSWDEAANEIMSEYLEILETDLQSVIGFAYSKPETLRLKLERLKPVIGAHALDIAKVFLGAAAATIIANKLNNRNTQK